VTSEAIVEIVNKKGLHARAAAKFVKTVAAFDAKVSVTKLAANGEGNSDTIDGADILDLLMLGADKTSLLRITANGIQAQDAINALQDLIMNRFDEPE